MKLFKMLGLLAVAAAAMMAFAGIASATIVTAPSGTLYTKNIHASSENGHTSLHGSNGVTVECPTSTVQGTIEKHGSTVTAEGPITSLTFGGAGGATTACTAGEIVHVLSLGRLTAHKIAGGATLTADEVVVNITTSIFGFPVNCEYKTGKDLDIGEVTNAPSATGHATFHIKAVIPRTGGSGLCGESGTWTGQYKIDTPTGLTFD
jgi:hypothetical protein